MIGWILIGGAVLTWPLAYWIAINHFANFQAELRKDNDFRKGEPLIDGSDRALSILVGMLAALIWPAALVIGALYLIFSKVTIFTPVAERKRLEQVELEQLRKQVAEYKIKGGEQL